MKRGRVELSKRTKEFPLYTGKDWLGRINQENIQQKSNSRNQKITYQYTQEKLSSVWDQRGSHCHCD